MVAVVPELMEPSVTPGAQTGLLIGSRAPSQVPPDYEDEFLRYLWRDYLYPKQYEWVLIAAYVAVFLVALVGNTLGRSLCPCDAAGFPWGLKGVLGLVSLPVSLAPTSRRRLLGGGSLMGPSEDVVLPLASPHPPPIPQSAWPCGGTTT